MPQLEESNVRERACIFIKTCGYAVDGEIRKVLSCVFGRELRLQGRGLCSHKDYTSTKCDRSVRVCVCVSERGVAYQGFES